MPSPDDLADRARSSLADRARSSLADRFGRSGRESGAVDGATESDAPADAEEPVVAVAPGRINLVGGHTDYSGGLVLPVAIDRHVAVAARPRDDDRIRGYSATLGETAERAIDAAPDATDWLDYPRGVALVLRQAGHEIGGADLAVAADLPVGAGLASSAALELAAGRAIAACHGVEVDDRDLAGHARTAEREVVGVDCGVMDQLAAALGRAGHALALDCRSLAVEAVPLPADRARVAVVDTGVGHELAESAYNDRVAACEAAAEELDGALEKEVETLRDVGVDDVEGAGAGLSEPLRRRALHVASENDRVRAAVEALREGDLELVGDLMDRSHASLRDRYGVSCAELDAAVDAARAVEGVPGARMTGAGFGGSVAALVRPGAADRFREQVATGYRERTGIDPAVYVCEATDGCRVVQ